MAFLLFVVSFIFFKYGSRKLGNLSLGVAVFLNPLGFDWIVYSINLLTKDYWMTISIMYMLTGIFFVGFLYLNKINIINMSLNKITKTHNKIKTKFKQNG